VNSPTRTLRFADEARTEFISAAQWYEEQRKGLGAQFVLVVEAKLNYIRKSPEVFPITYQEYRRALVKRFPFAIFFEVVGDSVHVLGIYHTSREPRDFIVR
jgi:toxin ParE1/3/4